MWNYSLMGEEFQVCKMKTSADVLEIRVGGCSLFLSSVKLSFRDRKVGDASLPNASTL